MEELVAWLVGIAVVLAIVVWVIMMVVMAILWVLSVVYTAIIWASNAFLAGLDIMIGFGGSMPLWVGWAVWGAVLGAALGVASSSSFANYRRVLLAVPPCAMVLTGIIRAFL